MLIKDNFLINSDSVEKIMNNISTTVTLRVPSPSVLRTSGFIVREFLTLRFGEIARSLNILKPYISESEARP